MAQTCQGLWLSLTLLRRARESLVRPLQREVDQLTDRLGDERDLAMLRDTHGAKWGRPDAVRARIGLIDARRRKWRRAFLRVATPVSVDKTSDVPNRMLHWWQQAVNAR